MIPLNSPHYKPIPPLLESWEEITKSINMDYLSDRAKVVTMRGTSTLDSEARSLDMIIASETPVKMFDWE